METSGKRFPIGFEVLGFGLVRYGFLSINKSMYFLFIPETNPRDNFLEVHNPALICHKIVCFQDSDASSFSPLSPQFIFFSATSDRKTYKYV